MAGARQQMARQTRTGENGQAVRQLATRARPRTVLLTMVLVLTPIIAGMSWAPPVRAATCAVPEAAPVIRGPATAAPSPPPSAVIQIEGENQATPIAIHVTPVATPMPTPDPIAHLTVELTAVSEAVAACLSAGDAEMVTRLAGERYLGQLFGGSAPLPREEYIAIADELTPVPTQILDVLDVSQPAANRAQATVTQVVGNQLMRAEWTFEHAPAADRQQGENPWRLAGERQLPAPAPPGARAIDVAIGDRSFTLDSSTATASDVVLRGDNRSAEDHEMLVLRLAAGYTTDDLLRATGPDLPQEVTYIGEQPVKAGAERDLVLVDLPAGTYTLVCLFPDAQGIPHLAQGMEAEFQVTG